MAKKEKEVYVIGILIAHKFNTEIKFVTDIDNTTNYVEWIDGEKAMEFAKETAKDIALGLCWNGYAAIPMLKASYLTLENPKKEGCD